LMRTGKIFGLFLGASLALSMIAAGQNATLRAPTAADWAAMAKLPDLGGVWEVGLGGGAAAAGRGAAGRGVAGAQPATPPSTQPGAQPPAQPAAGGRRGVTGGAARPSLTPAYAAKAQARQASNEDAQTANCLPPGLPAIMSQPYPIEILMTPGKVTLVIEAYTQVRHIFTDGRALPEDPDPNFYGTSVGRWEGDTLVVETAGFAQVARGLTFPYSDKMRIIERFKLADPDTLTIDTTIVDPEALTMPYSMGTRTLKRHRSWTIAEYICEENNRNYVDADGKAGIKLSNPLASPK
jgi:hypothetical protein